MRKIIEKVLMILFVTLLAFHFSYAQNPPQKVNANYQFQADGADSATRLPKSRAHNSNFVDTGMIYYNKSDKKIHWLYSLTGDTTFEGNALPDSTIIAGQGLSRTHTGSNINLASTNKWFNPVEYGAVGDGTTDNLSAFNSMISAAVAAGPGAHVYIPPGTYFTSATIVFPNTASFYVTGAGAGGGTGTGGQTAIVTSSTTVTAFEFDANFDQCYNILFKDEVTGSTSGSAVLATAGYFSMAGCYIQYYYNGIVATNSQFTWIDQCGFGEIVNHDIDLSNATDADGGDATISRCFFSSTAVTTSAALFQSNSGGTKISDCKILGGDGNFTDGFVINISGSNNSTSDFIAANCSIEQYSGTGIKVICESGGTFYNVSVIGGNISSYQGGNGILFQNLSGGNLSRCSISGTNINNNDVGVSIISVPNVKLSSVVNTDNSIAYSVTGAVPFIDNFISNSGSYTATGAATTSFTVTIPVQFNNTYSVGLTPTTLASIISPFYISAKTTSSFTVTFSVPITGAVGLDWNISNY